MISWRFIRFVERRRWLGNVLLVVMATLVVAAAGRLIIGF